MTSRTDKLHHVEPWPEGSRPQDTTLNGRHLTIEPVPPSRGLPRRVRVTDFDGNTCIYVPLMKSLRHPPSRDPVTFSVHDYCPVYLFAMPQTVEAMDAETNTCTYVAVNPRLMC